jgi:hypothetical protein
LDRDRALINRSLSVRYGITTPKTKSSRRMIQYGPSAKESSYAASSFSRVNNHPKVTHIYHLKLPHRV